MGKSRRNENENIDKQKNLDVQEKMIVQEILNDVKNHFNKTNNHCTNQQLRGHNDLF